MVEEVVSNVGSNVSWSAGNEAYHNLVQRSKHAAFSWSIEIFHIINTLIIPANSFFMYIHTPLAK